MSAAMARRVLCAGAATLCLVTTCLVKAPVDAHAARVGGSAAAAATVTPPDLQMLVPTNAISIGVDAATGHRMLRYSHVTADLGPGPFEIDPTYDSGTGTASFQQAIYASSSAGTWTYDHSVPVPAYGVFDAPSDYQFPLNSFALHSVAADGTAGPVVVRSPKTDYCITGDYFVGGANAPSQTYIPTGNCDDPTKPLGWSTGWGDEYDQTDSGQPIDLTGVADGTYILRGIADPEHVLTETDPTNNVTDTVLTISGTTVTVGAQTHPTIALPSVAITAPSAGSVATGTVTLSASAAATAPASVASVQFLLDGHPLGAPVTAAPYQMSWTVGSIGAGAHEISARVTDSTGAMNSAASVPIRTTGSLAGFTVDDQSTSFGTSPVTSAPITTSTAGDLVLAFVGSDGQSGQSATVSGGGLTWSLVKRADGQPGDAEIWAATAAGTLSGAAVTATAANAGYHLELTVVALANAAVGKSAAMSSTSAADSLSIAASAAGSIGLAVGNDWDQAAGRTLGSGQQLLSQTPDRSTGDTYWAQATTSGATAGGTITLNDTAPVGDHTNFAAVEVVPRGSTPPPPDTTPPAVGIVNPTNGQTVSGTISVAANATDNVAVSSVQFYLDGQPLGAAVTAPPYSVPWDTTKSANGSHTVYAIATDTANNTATSASVTVTVQNPAPPMTCFVVQAQVNAHGRGTQTTPAFHTATPGEQLVAFVTADGPAGAAQSATVTGAGLTWTLVRRSNAQPGDAEVWAATATSVLTSATVTSTTAVGGYDQNVEVVAMEGVSRIGNSTATAGPSGAPSASVVTSGPGASLVFAVGYDWDHSIARTLPTGQVLLNQWLDTSAGDTHWSQYTNQAVTPPGTTVTMTDPAPTSDRWDFVAVELVGDTA